MMPILPILCVIGNPDTEVLASPLNATVPIFNVAVTASITKLASPLNVIVPKSADNSRLGSCTFVAPCTVTDPKDNVADKDDSVISVSYTHLTLPTTPYV